jgi:hypothetical protein
MPSLGLSTAPSACHRVAGESHGRARTFRIEAGYQAGAARFGSVIQTASSQETHKNRK